jgi:hypothetical protein
LPESATVTDTWGKVLFIIAGANKKSHIIFTYNFINKIIVDHYSDIYELDEDTEENINFKLYDMIMRDGLI